MLVIIGADEWGNKDVLGLVDGFRESTQSWRELLLDLKHRGLEVAPKLAVGDGAMGFWAALHEVYGKTRVQRCWMHKTANVLNAMPKSVQPKAKAHLKDIWISETKAEADTAFDFFVEAYGVKYGRAVKCLTKDRTDLLAFYDFPAEHWKHIRTSNPPLSDCRQSPAGHRPPPNHQNQRLPEPSNRAGHDPPADAVGQEEVAQTRRPEPPARNHPEG